MITQQRPKGHPGPSKPQTPCNRAQQRTLASPADINALFRFHENEHHLPTDLCSAQCEKPVPNAPPLLTYFCCRTKPITAFVRDHLLKVGDEPERGSVGDEEEPVGDEEAPDMGLCGLSDWSDFGANFDKNADLGDI